MTTPAVKLDGVSMRFVIQHNKARSFQDAIVNVLHQKSGSSEEFWALRDVSFEVVRGETLGIIGENGSGKSTILKLITRILEPTRGKVAVSGKVSALIELGAGFHPDLSGRENIYLNGSIMGFGRKEMDRRFDEIVSFAELERFIDTPVKHYSSGMYARLGFSVAVSVDPDILIVDEVLSVGDEVFQRKCMDRINEFRRREKTIIIVSHGLPMIEQLCDRVLWLHRGNVLAQGRPASTIRAYLEEEQQHDERNRFANHRVDEGMGTLGVVAAASRPARPQVRGIQMFDAEGREKYTYRTGDTLAMRFACGNLRPGRSHAIALEVRRNDGLLIYRTAPRFLAEAESPEDSVEAEFRDLPLLTGTYAIRAHLAEVDGDDDPLPPEPVACSFSVWGGTDLGGMVQIKEHWREPAFRLVGV